MAFIGLPCFILIFTYCATFAREPARSGLDAAGVARDALTGTSASTAGVLFTLRAVVVAVLAFVLTNFVLVLPVAARLTVFGTQVISKCPRVARHASFCTCCGLECADFTITTRARVGQTTTCVVLSGRAVIIALFANGSALDVHKRSRWTQFALNSATMRLETPRFATYARVLSGHILERAFLAILTHVRTVGILVLTCTAFRARQIIARVSLVLAHGTRRACPVRSCCWGVQLNLASWAR
jgi:hypothetical protein